MADDIDQSIEIIALGGDMDLLHEIWVPSNKPPYKKPFGLSKAQNRDPKLVELFHELIDAAKKYKTVTGRHLPILGELGEFYAEIYFGLKRHKPRTQGSDGRRGNNFIEVKTITPEKNKDFVLVKSQGNFNQLLVVKINEGFEFEGKIAFRDKLPKEKGGVIRVHWDDISSKYQ